MRTEQLKPVAWVASSYRDFVAFPGQVQDTMGYALYLAQSGRMHASAKPLKGFGGGGVVEIVETDEAGSFRAIYTVRYASAVYVLHAFQKKSRRGIKTPRQEIELVRRRLKIAEEDNRGRERQ